jgi:hypothetical protein
VDRIGESEAVMAVDSESQAPDEIQDSTDHGNIGNTIAQIGNPFVEDDFKRALDLHFSALATKFNVDKYTIIFLLDRQDALSSWHADRIYTAASSASSSRPILLVLDSHGGSVEAGYLISKTCKRLSNEKFVVAIPRKAKSAATLLSLGADEIHMGLMSELGPIDPQIGGFPALGVKNALEILADLSCKYPGASTMLSQYIQAKLDLHILGYFERINESAMQYAERLLASKVLPSPHTPTSLSDHFVNHYKDHGFVIDYDEAASLLGRDIVRQGTDEYSFANSVFESYDLIKFCLDRMADKDIYIVGTGVASISVVNSRKPT